MLMTARELELNRLDTVDTINMHLKFYKKRLEQAKQSVFSSTHLFFEIQGFRSGLYCIQPLPEEALRELDELSAQCRIFSSTKSANEES